MLTENQRERLVKKIMGLVRESIAENGYFENFFPEKKEKKEKEEHGDGENSKASTEELEERRALVLKWLDSAQELHSVLAYELWPDKDEDSARSEFSKKYRGHDDEGKPYHFDDDEINTLYNMRSDFIERAGLKQK